MLKDTPKEDTSKLQLVTVPQPLQIESAPTKTSGGHTDRTKHHLDSSTGGRKRADRRRY